MRALFHWLTPLPKRGSGCTPRLPSSLVKQLDLNGDGKVWLLVNQDGGMEGWGGWCSWGSVHNDDTILLECVCSSLNRQESSPERPVSYQMRLIPSFLCWLLCLCHRRCFSHTGDVEGDAHWLSRHGPESNAGRDKRGFRSIFPNEITFIFAGLSRKAHFTPRPCRNRPRGCSQ
jgi:hypothetical protein